MDAFFICTVLCRAGETKKHPAVFTLMLVGIGDELELAPGRPRDISFFPTWLSLGPILTIDIVALAHLRISVYLAQ